MSLRIRGRASLLAIALLATACSAEASLDVTAAEGVDSGATDQPAGDEQIVETGPDVEVEGAVAVPPPEPTVVDRTPATSTTTIVVAEPGAPVSIEGLAGAITDRDAISEVAGGERSLGNSPTGENGLASNGLSAAIAEQNCVAPPEQALEEAPAWVTDALDAAVNHPDFAQLDVGVSVWIDGWGEVVTRTPDLPLVPASNEKILVAHAANELFDPTDTLDTTIEQLGADLVLRAGGDPTFSTWAARTLVDQVAASGITSADRLIIDVSDFPQPSAATGWQSWQIRNFVGPLSGLMLDDNRWNTSDEFLETPALINGQWIADALRAAGVTVNTVEVGTSPTGRTVGSVSSAPIGTLVRDMMLFSDNQIADMLTLQLGRVQGTGTLVDGIAQIEQVLGELCVPLAGVMDDGSGLSRSNLRSAREFQEILRAMRNTDTIDVFESQLPIGGVSGTLRGRFGGDAGRVQAKTGTIFGGRALSGYATTDSGRDVVFSIIINGERDTTSASLGAMDQLVRTILRS